MCGLVGMVGSFTDADKKAFRNMLRFDVVRGEDSTGIAVVDKGSENIRVFKKVGTPDMLFNAYENWSDRGVYEGPIAKLFIGHNRWATKGKVNDENAHPFHHNSVVGAHNGTLDSVFHLEDGYKFDVDSEAIFYNLDKYDAVDTIGNIEGAYALTWYDANENKLKIIRNKERPLHWTRRKDSDVIYWASLPWMLELGLAYANISHGEVYAFETDTLYTFDLDEVEDGKMKETKWAIKRDVKGKEPQWKNYDYSKGYKYVPPENKGAGKSNVSPFKAPSSSSSSANSSTDLSKDELVQWGAWEGKEIDFLFQGKKKGMSGLEYLSAYPANPLLTYNIRVFASNKPEYNVWADQAHKKTFTGKVKKFVRFVDKGKKEYYLAIDLRTIREKPEPAAKEGESSSSLEKEQRWYDGFNHTFLSHREWEKATRFGCEICNETADEDDDCIHWLGDDTFVCGECATNELHKDFLQNAYSL